MKRRDELPAIPPYVDQWGRPTYDNPLGQNRPNPATNGIRDRATVVAELVEAVALYEKQAAHNVRLADGSTPPVAEVEETPAASRAERITQARARLHRRVRVTAVAMLAVIGVAGSGAGAYAYFTASGSGSGSASVGTITVTVNATAGIPSTPLFPDGDGDVTLRVDNPNSFDVKLTTVTRTGPIMHDGGHSGCSPTGVTFDDQSGLNVNIAASGTTAVDLSGAAHMDTTSANGCQGATFSIPVSVTVKTP